MALIATKAQQKRKPPFLPDETLDKLKCYDCGGYLSTPPIMKHPEFGSICGFCAIYNCSDELIRNEEYEAVASFIEFPCKNKGCHKRVLFGKMDQHEHNCLFRQYECPVGLSTMSCTWTGNSRELGTHFAEKHPELFMEGHTFQPELRKNCEQTRLLSFENNLFLVQTKCVVLSCKFLCLVRFIGHPKKSEIFTYFVEITGDKKKSNSYVSGEKTIQTDICMVMEISAAAEVNITSMLSQLNCPRNVFCTVHIKKIQRNNK